MKPTGNNGNKQKTKTYAVKLQDTVVSHPFHQIKYDNMTSEVCPRYAFKLPVFTSFSVFDQSY